MDVVVGKSEQPNHVEDDSRILVDLQRISASRSQGQAGADRADGGHEVRKQEGHPRPQPRRLQHRPSRVRAQVPSKIPVTSKIKKIRSRMINSSILLAVD